MPIELQAKLLRVLQERVVMPVGSDRSEHVDIRVIAATHVDLEEAIKNGRFREDLFFRLNVLSVRIPPLRQRKDDIPVLARFFISQSHDRANLGISREALEALMEYDWPGNVRELRNAIEHAIVVTVGDRIMRADLPDTVKSNPETDSTGEIILPEKGISLDTMERDLII